MKRFFIRQWRELIGTCLNCGGVLKTLKSVEGYHARTATVYLECSKCEKLWQRDIRGY